MQDVLGKFSQIVPILLVFLIFYFLVIRPQQKKARDHQEMLKAIKRGDCVVLSGGIVGTVDRILNDSEIMLTIGIDLTVLVLRSAIAQLYKGDFPLKRIASPGQLEEVISVSDESGEEKKKGPRRKNISQKK